MATTPPTPAQTPADKAKEEMAKKEAEFNPATKWERVGVAAALALATVAVVVAWVAVLDLAQSTQDREYRTGWTPSAGVSVSPGPPELFYDAGKRELVARGAISAEKKRDLVALLTKDDKPISPPNKAGATYWEALDRLAFQSNASNGRLSRLLVLLGGLSGLLGVMLRTTINFVGVAVHRNVLDITRWWPYYAIRPLIGFLLGMMAILLLRVGLLDTSQAAADNITWGLILGILGGFGSDEFTQKLRLLVKTLFGDADKPSDKKATS